MRDSPNRRFHHSAGCYGVRGGFDANALELWELHKKEWSQGGIYPVEEDTDRKVKF